MRLRLVLWKESLGHLFWDPDPMNVGEKDGFCCSLNLPATLILGHKNWLHDQQMTILGCKTRQKWKLC